MLVGRGKEDWGVLKSLFIFGWYDETGILMYIAQNFQRIKGRWIRLPYPLLGSKWLHLADPLKALPCSPRDKNRFTFELFCSPLLFFCQTQFTFSASLPLFFSFFLLSRRFSFSLLSMNGLAAKIPPPPLRPRLGKSSSHQRITTKVGWCPAHEGR